MFRRLNINKTHMRMVMTPISLNSEGTVGLCEFGTGALLIGKFRPARLAEWLKAISKNSGKEAVYLLYLDGVLIATQKPKDEVGVCVAGMDE
jgi:hypothetical protein